MLLLSFYVVVFFLTTGRFRVDILQSTVVLLSFVCLRTFSALASRRVSS